MGTLYLVATPIGNLEDITLRALRILKEVDLIACEDTRHTAGLLTRYGIATPRESYHKFNEESSARRLIQLLHDGKNIALVSDSGTPLISDPGHELVTSCRREGITVIPIPGPSAAIAALIGSGLPSDNFYFAGFLPARGAPRKRRLEELAAIPSTLIFYEGPHRLLDSLEDMIEILGTRRACIARELTKIHEEFVQGALPELLDIFRARPKIQGEITIIIERGKIEQAVSEYPESLQQHLEMEMQKTGFPRNEALKLVAKQRGITRKQAYDLLTEEKQEPEAGSQKSELGS
jgi:16S rRNA (cytidine1402-2'-O)-methyltransferase